MKHQRLVSVLLAVCLAGSGPAFAQGNSNHDKQKGKGRGDPHQQQQRGDPHQKQRWDEQGHRNDGGPRDGRGAGPDHDYYQGDRVPQYYRSRQYVVDDWRGHNLRQPPQGYHWVQYGPDYVLVAIATGVILQLLLSR